MNHPDASGIRLTQERGLALVLVLMLLAAASLLATKNLLEAGMEERSNARFRQSQWALATAETGALHATSWWSSTDASGQRNDIRFWENVRESQEQLGQVMASADPRLESRLLDLEFAGDTVRFSVQGTMKASGLTRTLVIVYQRPRHALQTAGPQETVPVTPDDSAARTAHGLMAWFEPRHVLDQWP